MTARSDFALASRRSAGTGPASRGTSTSPSANARGQVAVRAGAPRRRRPFGSGGGVRSSTCSSPASAGNVQRRARRAPDLHLDREGLADRDLGLRGRRATVGVCAAPRRPPGRPRAERAARRSAAHRRRSRALKKAASGRSYDSRRRERQRVHAACAGRPLRLLQRRRAQPCRRTSGSRRVHHAPLAGLGIEQGHEPGRGQLGLARIPEVERDHVVAARAGCPAPARSPRPGSRRSRRRCRGAS